MTVSVPMRRSVLSTLLPAALIVLGGLWAWANFRSGRLMADPSGVTMITITRPGDGEKDVLPNTFISADLNSGHAIDPGTVSSRAVRLYRASDGQNISAAVTLSAGGDAIVLQPQSMLEPRTEYTFEVTRQIKDRNGMALLPYRMNFTTGGGQALSRFPVAFEKVELPVGEGRICTALAVGPDHRLYVGMMRGSIVRWDIKPDGTLSNKQVIDTIVQQNHKPRLITGICFDPIATAENPILWVSHGQYVQNQRGEFSFEGADDWTGKISRISGPELSDYRDVIINLPRSWRDHLNNQITFGPDRALYWSQGSHTAMGAPDTKWGHRTERLLSAAILRADVRRIDEALDVKTEEGGTYDPFAKGALVAPYATGVRVAFDVLWHSNGYFYTATNGSAAGGATPGSAEKAFPRRIDEERFGPYDGTRVPPLMGVPETMDDYLIRVEQGAYYGHPNPSRGEYALYGANPTAAKDPLEISAYPQGTQPDRNFHLPIYSFGQHISPNGLLEFKSQAFGGALNGKILITRFSGGKDIMVLVPGKNGVITETISGIGGLTNFQDPLDLAEDDATGFVYVAEFRGAKLALLRPVDDPAKAATMSTNVFVQKVVPIAK